MPSKVINSYKDLQVWQKAITLANDIYAVTENFPSREVYGLSNQLRRAAVSIASNIAEGSVRGRKEFKHFIAISRGSLAEVETQLIIAKNRGFVTADSFDSLIKQCDELSRMLFSLERSLST